MNSPDAQKLPDDRGQFAFVARFAWRVDNRYGPKNQKGLSNRYNKADEPFVSFTAQPSFHWPERRKGSEFTHKPDRDRVSLSLRPNLIRYGLTNH
jgi:hypothetical protein